MMRQQVASASFIAPCIECSRHETLHTHHDRIRPRIISTFFGWNIQDCGHHLASLGVLLHSSLDVLGATLRHQNHGHVLALGEFMEELCCFGRMSFVGDRHEIAFTLTIHMPHASQHHSSDSFFITNQTNLQVGCADELFATHSSHKEVCSA